MPSIIPYFLVELMCLVNVVLLYIFIYAYVYYKYCSEICYKALIRSMVVLFSKIGHYKYCIEMCHCYVLQSSIRSLFC